MVVEMPQAGSAALDDSAWELTAYLDQGMVREALSLHCLVLRNWPSHQKAEVESASACRAHWKASTMFKLHAKHTATLLPAGTKRKHPDADMPGPSCVADATPARVSWLREQACFQLLHVNGIPSWANRPPGGCRLREVVHGSMKWVLASNYMVDMTWLLSACPDLITAGQLLIVHGERTPDRVGAIKAAAASAGLANLVVHAPPLPIQFGTYHSKAFVIEYEAGLRVVVHTANLIYVDCNNKTQGLWFQDFPRKSQASPATSEFEQELVDYLRALRLPAESAQKAEALCSQHDFSSARVHLIISRPGYHSGPALRKYGHLRVQALLAREKFPPHFQRSPLIAQFSSLGSLDERWLTNEFRGSLSAGLTSSGGRLGAGAAGPQGFQLIWPTVQDIRDSVEGWRGGASVPGPAKNVNKPFLQPYWHRWGGEPWGRQRAMPHIKSYTRYQGQQVAWFILASHNLSKAAWGALQKQGTQLFIRSFELGVMFLPSLEARYQQHPHQAFTCTRAMPGNRSSQQQSPDPRSSPDPICRGPATSAKQSTQHPSSSDPAGTPNAATDASGEREYLGLFDAGSQGSKQGAAHPMIEFWTSQSEGGDSSHPGPDTCRLMMPIPYLLPPKRYAATDTPWCVDIEYSGVDALGRGINDPVESFYGRVQPPD
ncbi:hypothetical protein ABBQ38_009882 [Trebouxia sp. C0009 RCD-2024]